MAYNEVVHESLPSSRLRRPFNIDWILFASAVLVSIMGLVTMNSFSSGDTHFEKQLVFLAVSIIVFFGVSLIDFRFLRRTSVVVSIFVFAFLLLLALFGLGKVAKGAQSWFSFGGFSFQPSDPIKIALIILLAKYFSRRHIEIRHIRHIIVSGVYAFLVFILVLLQPDFGSAIIIFLIWLGMVLVSGLSKKHLALVFLVGLVAFAGAWQWGFKTYQKDRIVNFFNPLQDIHGSGYNVFQAIVAVGSGEALGKGIGYGTQSKLKFLPEYQTDFIFAAYAEEWGYIGVLLLFLAYGVLVWRIMANAYRGETNFEILYGAGVAIFLLSHFIINAGMNLGVMPVTGITFPFMSYGGSHLVTEFLAIGILMSMRRYNRPAHKDAMKNEFLGI
jgi:rod shape determining protein RodA